MLEKGGCEGGLQLPVVAFVTSFFSLQASHSLIVWVLHVKYLIQTNGTSQLVCVELTVLKKHCSVDVFLV